MTDDMQYARRGGQPTPKELAAIREGCRLYRCPVDRNGKPITTAGSTRRDVIESAAHRALARAKILLTKTQARHT